MPNPQRTKDAASMSALRERSVVDYVYRALKDAVLTGEIAPGRRLVEETVARELKVSRTPVREAIRRLHMERLVQRGHNGFVVADFTPEQIADLYATLAVLEGLAANLSAQTMLPRDHAKLRHIQRQFEAAVEHGNVEAMVALNQQFHAEIVRASRNETVISFVEQIRDTIRRFRMTTLVYPGRAQRAAQEHARLTEAIVSRKAGEAERLCREHLNNSLQVRLVIQNEAAAAQLEPVRSDD